MQKGHSMTPRSAARRRVDQAQSGRGQRGEVAFQVRCPERHVVQPFATSGQETAHGSVRAGRFEQLDAPHEGDQYALLLEPLGWGAGGPDDEFERAAGARDGVDCEAHVVERSTPTQRRSHVRMLRPAPISDKECLDGHE